MILKGRSMRVLFIGNTRLGDAILSTPILNHYNKKKMILRLYVVCCQKTSIRVFLQ